MATPDDNSTPENPGGQGPRGALTVKQQAFAAAYVENGGNATQAAIRAGYSPRTAQQIGSRLAKDANVRAEIDRLAAEAKAQPERKASKQPETAKAIPQEAPAFLTQLLARQAAQEPHERELVTTPTEEAFITEYLRNGGNGAAAWIYTRPGTRPGPASSSAARLLRKPWIAKRIADERARLVKAHEMTRDALVAEFLAIVRADPNELTQLRKVACARCWDGDDSLGQWADPDPDCEECAGEGNPVPWFADTRNLSPEGRALFAGVKLTKDGVQILMHDKLTALVNIGRILGVFEADNRQKQPAVTEAVAQFLGQLHGAGKARLRFVERVK